MTETVHSIVDARAGRGAPGPRGSGGSASGGGAGSVDRVEAAVRAALGDEVCTRESSSGTDDFPGACGVMTW
ncbi:hypothetical protein [Streptomyces sp. Cmuel-A718b]|uniref:hypothetical protein n=1 Tax=Streptomyces sp. Cmuel-A718b TaxID=697328 RepID=UPI000B8624CC|nr:hypothetical protein [Streptomyces sp. Cmuel-A718b]